MLLVRRVQISKAVDTCGELRDGNSGLHGALLCLVVVNGCAHLHGACNSVRVAAGVGNTLVCLY